MILVNTPGSWNYIWPFLLHAEWHGFSLPDLVFPGFLFSVGLSMALSMNRKPDLPLSVQLKRVLYRSLLIFVVGLLLNWFPFYYKHVLDLRIFGVLQRIAMSYLLAGVLVIYLKPNKRLVIVTLFLLLTHLLILIAFGSGEPFSLSGNVSGRIDLAFLSESQVYRGFGIPFDPEGLLGSLGGAAQVVIGYIVARVYLIPGINKQTVLKLIVLGIVFIGGGLLLGLYYPINKPIWTGSYVVYSSGILMVVLGLLIQLIDVLAKNRWTYFFQVFGLNPLASFVLSVMIVKLMYITLKFNDTNAYVWIYTTLFQPVFGNYLGSFMFAVAYTLLIWVVAWLLYRKRIIIKL